jgi:aspartate-semialdehyde dehydrogenase
MSGFRIDDLLPGMPRRRMSGAQRASLARALDGRMIAVVGATGAVGLEALALLAEAGVPSTHVHAIASDASAGSCLPYAGSGIRVGSTEDLFRLVCDDRVGGVIALLATPAPVSRELVPRLRSLGVPVSDNSSAFRATAPLVIPEINPGAAVGSGLLASPNCTTTIALTAAAPIVRASGVRSIEITSYQAVSGAGLGAMRALIEETTLAVGGRRACANWLDHPAAFSVFPHESDLDSETGLCAEEAKFAYEAPRILGDARIGLAATCMRVPVLRTHTVAVRVATARPAHAAEIRRALASAPGVRTVGQGPSSLDASCLCDVLVGRVRVEPDPDGGGSVVRLIAAGDQLLKGAAWNALQNAALLAPFPSPRPGTGVADLCQGVATA